MSAINNYFRAGTFLAFFNSRSIESISEAWLLAATKSPFVCVWRPFLTWPEAAWYNCPIVGLPSASLVARGMTGVGVKDTQVEEVLAEARAMTKQAWAEAQTPFTFTKH